jgi:hypothetical protein
MKLQNASLLAAGSLLLAATSALARKWIDDTGKFSVEADFAEVKGNSVVLRRSTGALITVPIARLSKADQEYLQSLEKPGSQLTKGGPETQPTVTLQDEKLAIDLQKGSIISIRANGQPLGSVLTQIESGTGNRLRVVDEFGRDDEQVLPKRVTISLQERPFWEAVDAVTNASGVKFLALKDGVLQLSTEGPRFDNVRVVGATAVVGAFQVYPGFDDFFDNAMIVIRPEPRFGEPQVRSYEAEITLPDGKQIQYRPDFMLSTSNIHTGELTLRIDPDLPKGAKKAQHVKVAARLAIASDPKAFTLPALGELAPKPVRLGDGALYVTKAQLTGEPAGRQALTVELSAEGLAFDLKDIALVDVAGNRMESLGEGRTKEEQRQAVSLSFPREKMSGDPRKCRLAFQVPGAGEKIIGPLEDLAPRSAPAGAAALRITRATMNKQPDGTEDFEVRIEFDGVPVSPGRLALVDGGTQTLKPRG